MRTILQKIKQKKTDYADYPYNILTFEELEFTAPVTFLTGDNGSGKSTLLRIIKTISDAIDIGKGRPFDDEIVQGLEKAYQLSWSVKTKRGFYLQSEDFLQYIQWSRREETYYETQLAEVEQRHQNKQSIGCILEAGLHQGHLNKMKTVQKEIGEASHGEGYLGFFKSYLRPNSLYLLDEPETPLSFESQLALLCMIKEAVQKGSQFIICTHSPVLLAYPEADIFYLNHQIQKYQYSEHPIIQNLQNFLENPERFMHYLLEDES